MKRFLLLSLTILLFSMLVTAKQIAKNDKFFNGTTLYTVSEIRMGSIIYFTGNDIYGESYELTLEKVKGKTNEFKLIPSRQAEEPPFNCEWNSPVKYINQDGMHFLAIYNGDMITETLVLTPDDLTQCHNQMATALKQPLSELVSNYLMNHYAVNNFNSDDLRTQMEKLGSKKKNSLIEDTNLQLIELELAKRWELSNNVEVDEDIIEEDDAPIFNETISDAITNQLKAIYAHVSRAFDLNSNEYVDLDKMYCSRDWQETYAAVEEIDNQKETAEEMFFVEDMHWTSGMEVPLTVKNVEIKTDDDDTVWVYFDLCDKNDDCMRQCVTMVFEDGEWKIDSWVSPWGDWNMLEDMKNYVINGGRMTIDQ
ncbi:MAG: hypothetical protein J6S96_04470 [Muribaculaceae bacterium]|nr:hypothetical protein [Muribaculaceae bacterium]